MRDWLYDEGSTLKGRLPREENKKPIYATAAFVVMATTSALAAFNVIEPEYIPVQLTYILCSLVLILYYKRKKAGIGIANELRVIIISLAAITLQLFRMFS